MVARKPAGSTRTNKKGYVMIKVIDHPTFGTGYVRRSHLVFVEGSGKPIPAGFDVHHRDENKANDFFSNLELLPHGAHAAHHRRTGTPWNKGTKGLYSEEHKAKIANANRERKWKPESKKKIARFAKQRKDLARDEKGKFK